MLLNIKHFILQALTAILVVAMFYTICVYCTIRVYAYMHVYAYAVQPYAYGTIICSIRVWYSNPAIPNAYIATANIIMVTVYGMSMQRL